MRRGFLLALLLLLVTACASQTVTPPATEAPIEEPAPGSQEIPQALLRTSSGAVQVGATGSYCWGTVCADAIGPVAPGEALTVAPDEELTFELMAGEPGQLSLRVLQWQPSEFEGRPGTVILDPQAPLVASGDLEPTATTTWNAPTEPGEYALLLFSTYVQGGDISYGWHIVVGE